MDKKEENIIEAAFSVFSRFGVKRTTMNDIATEAKIARQTLYNAFENKDDVLRATIRLNTERTLAAIEAEFQDVADFGEKIDIAFENIVAIPCAMIRASPHFEELVNGFKDTSKKELEAADTQYKKVFEDMLRPYAARIEDRGLTLSDLAECIIHATNGFKRDSEDEKHLRGLLTSLKRLVLCMVEGG
jgi:AcrR family transcriptional regulator